MRVYTFTLPKFVSSMVRKCAVIFQKESQAKPVAAGKTSKQKKRKKEKTQGA